MADALATLLVQEGAVTLEGLARAQALQREQGGSLDTALLELGLVGERRLVATLARASGLPAAPATALVEPDPRSRRVFPAKVAERHGLAPYRLEGKELHLLATWPVDVAALDEISFMLSLHLVPHVAAEWRVWELRRRVYDAPPPERYAALAARLAQAPEEPEPPEPEVAAPAEAPEPASAAAPAPPAGARPAPSGAGPEPEPRAELEPIPVPEPPVPAPALEPMPMQTRAQGTAQEPAAPGDPLARALAEAVELAEAAVGDAPLPVSRAAVPAERVRPARWSLAEARQALAAAATRDEAVAALLRYALDFFEHAALLATGRGELNGHEALGADPEARARARAVSLPCGDTGIVRAVVETGGPYLGPPGPDAVVEALVAGLGRPLPRTMLLYPVQIRDRVVCLLYADNGEAPVSPRRVGDLLLLASEVGAALLRILAARKAAPPPAPAPEERPPPEEPAELTWESLAPPPEVAPAADLDGVPLEPLQVEPPAELQERSTLLFAELPALSGAEPAPVLAEPPPRAPDEEPPRLDTGPEAAFAAEEPLPAAAQPPSFAPLPETLSLELPPPGDGRTRPPVPVAAAVPEGDVGPTLPPPGEGEPGWSDLAAPEQRPPDAAIDQEPHDAFSPPPTFDAAQAVRQLEATRRGSAERARLLALLALHGPESAAVLAAALPGQVNVRAPGGEESLPLAERSAVLEALCALDIVATPWLVEVLADPDARRRRYAALLLGQVGDPAAFLPLSDRVFDPDPSVASAAMGALCAVRGHPDFRPVLERLRRALHGEPPRPAFAARALVALGDGGAVGPLIGMLEGAPATVSAAAEALEALTARRLGRDPVAWAAWWQAHRGRRRTEWLFEALADGDREVRIAAAEALRAVGPSPVRFFADAPEAERLRSAGEWREWFESHGLEA